MAGAHERTNQHGAFRASWASVCLRIMLIPTLLLHCNLAAKGYEGSECSGIVGFQLVDDADSGAMDSSVAAMLGETPMYLRHECAAGLRQFYCLWVFSGASEDGLPFCASVCEHALQSACASYFAHFDDTIAVSLRNQLQMCEGSSGNSSTCLMGGSSTAIQQADCTKCPAPFVATNRDATYLVEGTGCAASCEAYPTLESWEWDVVYAVYQYTSIAGLAAGVYCSVLFTIKATSLSKQSTSWSTIYVLLFSIGCVGASAALFKVAIPSPVGAFCEHSVIVKQRTTECLIQGTVWTWFTIWTSIWMIIQSFELYAKIVKGFSTARLAPFQRMYAFYAIGVPTLLVTCIHIMDGMAYDEDTGVPFCVPSMRTLVFQHVFYYMPQAVFGTVAAIFFVVALHGSTKIINIRRIHHTNTNSRNINRRPSFASALDGLTEDRQVPQKGHNFVQRFLAMNVQALSLLAMYTTGVLYVSIWRMVETVQRPHQQNSLDEWTECVFRHGTTDPHAGQDECGSKPSTSPSLVAIVVGLLFMCSYGLLPFFCFAYGLHCAPNNVFSLLRIRNQRQNRSNSSIILDKGAQGVRGIRKISLSDLDAPDHAGEAMSTMASEVEIQSVIPAASVRTGSGSTALEHGRLRSTSRATSMEFEQSMRIKVNDADVAEVIGPLGAGGFGLVYRVNMLRDSGKHAAMKCARFEGRGQLKRADLELCHEARICLSLGRHDHLVSLRYVCRDESLSTSDSLQRFLLFYDLVEGPNMKICLEQRYPSIFRTTDSAAMISERLTKFTKQLLSAVAYMHSKDVIHEDIKPDNILVDRLGFIKVADFGLSSQGVRDHGPNGKLKAPLQGFTAGYRSPEIAKHSTQFQVTADQSKPQQSGRYRSAKPQPRATSKHFTSRVSTKATSSANATVITPAASDVWATALTIFEMFMVGTVAWAPQRGETGRRVIDAYEEGMQLGEAWDWTQDQLAGWFGDMRLPVPVSDSPGSSHTVRRNWSMDGQELEQIMTQAYPGIKRSAIIRVRNSLKSVLQFSMPPALLNMLKLCLAPNVNDRPQDGQEMLDLLADDRRATDKLISLTQAAGSLQPILSEGSRDDGDIELGVQTSMRLVEQPTGETTSLRASQRQLEQTWSARVPFRSSNSTRQNDSSTHTNSSTPHQSSAHISDVTSGGMGSHSEKLAAVPIRLSMDAPLSPGGVNAQDLAIMYYNLGLAFNAGGDLEAAVQCYYEAKFTDPDYAPTYYNLGIAVRAQGLMDAAQEYFATALSHDETDAKAHYNYGMCMYSVGDRRQSSYHLKRAIELQPHYAQAYYGLAKIAADKANFPKLVRYMKQAINNGIRTPKMYWRLGRAQRLTDDIAGAIQSYNQALALQKSFVPAHAFLTLEEALGSKRLNIIRMHSMKARSRGRTEDPDKTLLTCRVLATYGEAMAWKARNDVEGADLCYDDAERDTTWCHCMVADLLWAYGEVKQAARAYQRAVSRIEHELRTVPHIDRQQHEMMLVVVNRRLEYTLAGGGAQEEWKRELLFCEEQMPYPSLVW